MPSLVKWNARKSQHAVFHFGFYWSNVGNPVSLPFNGRTNLYFCDKRCCSRSTAAACTNKPNCVGCRNDLMSECNERNETHIRAFAPDYSRSPQINCTRGGRRQPVLCSECASVCPKRSARNRKLIRKRKIKLLKIKQTQTFRFGATEKCSTRNKIYISSNFSSAFDSVPAEPVPRSRHSALLATLAAEHAFVAYRLILLFLHFISHVRLRSVVAWETETNPSVCQVHKRIVRQLRQLHLNVCRSLACRK